MKKVGLICEGGGTKIAYSCGVLKCFLDYDITFPYTVGISAGAEVLLPFVSKQKDRLRITGVEAASNPKAIGMVPLFKEKGLFGIRLTCEFIENKAPLDYETFIKNETKLDVGLYNIEENKVEYFGKEYLDPNDQKLIIAACSLFILNRPVKFQGKMYMDAGLVDMIPIEQSIRQGMEKHIIISTKEEDFVRKPAGNYQVHLARMMYPRNKKIRENLKIRHINYAKQWKIVRKLEKEQKALILRPSADYGVTRYTHEAGLLGKWFDLGYEDTLQRLDTIKTFMNE